MSRSQRTTQRASPTRTETVARRARRKRAKRARQLADGELRALDRERRRYGITYEQIATEAERTTQRRRGTVGIPTVSRVVRGESTSANVIGALKRLLVEQRRRERERSARAVESVA